MLIELPDSKRIKVLSEIQKFEKLHSCTIREFASFVGTLGACFRAARYGWVYMKSLEREKTLALIANNNKFEKAMILSNNIKEDLAWWKSNIMSVTNPIKTENYTTEIFSDASRSGCEGERSYGHWDEKDRKHHINYLELLSAFFGLKCFAKELRNYCNVLLRIDNTTAIAYINLMGGTRYQNLSRLAKDIWYWCEQRNLGIFASYIRSEENTIADSESRKREHETEVGLSKYAFDEICRVFGKPEINLFASRANAKCSRYISWQQDPNAITIDAFTINWQTYFFYAFPPFSVILKMLRKIQSDRAQSVIVVLHWPSQAWYPLYMEMFEPEPIYFKPDMHLLHSACREPHPLWRCLTLVAGISCGKSSH